MFTEEFIKACEACKYELTDEELQQVSGGIVDGDLLQDDSNDSDWD